MAAATANCLQLGTSRMAPLIFTEALETYRAAKVSARSSNGAASSMAVVRR
jgi:hypothetical protein